MKNLTLFFFVLSFITSSAQEESNWKRFQSVDYMLIFNPNSNKDNYYDGNTGQMEKPSKFVLGGLAGHYEYGISFKEWFRFGLLTGVYANVFESVYTIPVTGTITLAPLIAEETRVYGKFAYGWNTAIGRGNLNGRFTHYHLGVEFSGGSRIFLFANDHQFQLNHEVYQTLGIGFGGTLFKDKK